MLRATMDGVGRLLAKEARHATVAPLLLVDAFLILAVRRTAAVTWKGRKAEEEPSLPRCCCGSWL